MTVFADDASSIHRSKGGMTDIAGKLQEQGMKIESVLRKLGLAMNQLKTQFLITMTYQRQKPSRRKENREYEGKTQIQLSESKIDQKDTLRTLGVDFDERLTFRKHWEKVIKSCWGRIFVIGGLSKYININKRNQLAKSLIVGKLAYCIEATTTGPKNVMLGPVKVMNRCVRAVTGEWNREETKNCYSALGWLNIKELTVWRTVILAKKILANKDPMELLSRIAVETQRGWEVKAIKKYRTEAGRRMFSARVSRIWSLLTPQEKIISLKSKSGLMKLKKKIVRQDLDWILWGRGEPNQKQSLNTPTPSLEGDNGSNNEGSDSPDKESHPNSDNRSHTNEEMDKSPNDVHEPGDTMDESYELTGENLISIMLINKVEAKVLENERDHTHNNEVTLETNELTEYSKGNTSCKEAETTNEESANVNEEASKEAEEIANKELFTDPESHSWTQECPPKSRRAPKECKFPILDFYNFNMT